MTTCLKSFPILIPDFIVRITHVAADRLEPNLSTSRSSDPSARGVANLPTITLRQRIILTVQKG